MLDDGLGRAGGRAVPSDRALRVENEWLKKISAVSVFSFLQHGAIASGLRLPDAA